MLGILEHASTITSGGGMGAALVAEVNDEWCVCVPCTSLMSAEVLGANSCGHGPYEQSLRPLEATYQ